MEYDLLLKNAQIINEKSGVTEKCTIGINGSKIAGIHSSCGSFDHVGRREIDCSGKLVLPGFVDLHVHFREPGYEYKEDIYSGSCAAVAGGVTSVFCMPNTNPVCDRREVVDFINSKAEKAKCRIFQVGAITKGLSSDMLTDFTEMNKAGIIAFSNDGKPVLSSKTLKAAMTEALKLNVLIMSHCEEMSLSGGVMNEGQIADELGLDGIPSSCEDIATARDVILAGETGCRLHICHVSTAGSVNIIRQAKKLGINVTAETCPHYFSMTDSDVKKYGSLAKMSPPLRGEADRLAIIEGLCDRTIDCISTDHAPHSAEEKGRDIRLAPMGIIGLQTSFAVTYTELVKKGIMTIGQIVQLMSRNPAKIAGIDRFGIGSIEEGSTADISVVDTDTPFVLKESDLAGKSTNSPFLCRELFGRVVMTFRDGKMVYSLNG